MPISASLFAFSSRRSDDPVIRSTVYERALFEGSLCKMAASDWLAGGGTVLHLRRRTNVPLSWLAQARQGSLSVLHMRRSGEREDIARLWGISVWSNLLSLHVFRVIKVKKKAEKLPVISLTKTAWWSGLDLPGLDLPGLDLLGLDCIYVWPYLWKVLVIFGWSRCTILLRWRTPTIHSNVS